MPSSSQRGTRNAVLLIGSESEMKKEWPDEEKGERHRACAARRFASTRLSTLSQSTKVSFDPMSKRKRPRRASWGVESIDSIKSRASWVPMTLRNFFLNEWCASFALDE
jgi:hypothetical protein